MKVILTLRFPRTLLNIPERSINDGRSSGFAAQHISITLYLNEVVEKWI